MLNKIKNRKQEGFTIIEVLIVLAIAGLIMLIVFLAVPALQRNSRNTQRQADGSKVATSISTCMSARNGQVASCGSFANLSANGGLETTKLQQITTVNMGNAVPSDPGAGVFNIANGGFKAKCADDGATAIAGTDRQAAVLFRQENGQAAGLLRCIDV